MDATSLTIENAVSVYGDLMYRLCFSMLGNRQDAEDAVQETLLKLLKKAPRFHDQAHEKAWLIHVSANQCRDMLRKRKRHLPELQLPDSPPESSEDSRIFSALMHVPETYRLVLLLYYAEEYRVNEIAKIIGRTPSAVKMRLQKGRRLLEEAYRKENAHNEL